jgi:hypothetical protein
MKILYELLSEALTATVRISALELGISGTPNVA